MKKGKRKFIAFAIVAVCLAVALGVFYWQGNSIVPSDNDEPISHTNENLLKQNFTDMSITDAYTAIVAVSDFFEITDSNTSFELHIESNTSTGATYRLAQYYRNVPVIGGNVVVSTDGSGRALLLTGNFIEISGVSMTPRLSENDIIARTKVLWGESIRARNLRLVFYSFGAEPILSYEMEIEGIVDDEFVSKTVFINADDGNLISLRNNIVNLNMPSTINRQLTQNTIPAIGQDRGDNDGGFHYDLPFYEIDGEIVKFCSHRRIAVYSFNFENFRGILAENPYYLKDRFLTSRYSNVPANTEEVVRFRDQNRAAADAFDNIIVTYDFFANRLGWRQFNNDPSTHLAILVDVQTNGTRNNAFWWDGIIAFEVPANTGYIQYSVNLDVVSHEFAHGVNRATWGGGSGGRQLGEYGAIDEALADIFGEIVEHYHTGYNDWKILGGYVRNFYDGRGMRFDPSEGGHRNSLVLTWIAREIARDFDFSNTNQLVAYAQLWHGVQLRLPYHRWATFQSFADTATIYAMFMLSDGRITEAQFNPVQTAFENNGVIPSVVLDDVGQTVDTDAEEDFEDDTIDDTPYDNEYPSELPFVGGVDPYEIIEAYMQFMRQREFMVYLDLDSSEPSPNEFGYWYLLIPSQDSWYYLIVDIDSDGVPELVLEYRRNDWPSSILLVFSYDTVQGGVFPIRIEDVLEFFQNISRDMDATINFYNSFQPIP